MVFKISNKYSLLTKWLPLRRFVKKRYWFIYFDKAKDNVAKRKYIAFVILGLAFQFTAPYSYKFSYKNMPKVKGRRKV